MIVEVCLEHYDDAVKAVMAGVERIELNSALSVGGLTPSRALVRRIVTLDVKCIAMIRLRGNDFVFTPNEIDMMYEDALDLLQLGIDGIAFGALTSQQRIDQEVMARFANLCKQFGKELVCHRAIDQSSSYFEDLALLIESGVTRVLTSGAAATAQEGIITLSEAQKRFGERIEILPGCGINKDNVMQIIEETGCSQVHGTFSKKEPLPYNSTISFAEYPDGLMRVFDVEHYMALRKQTD